jgi:hypothetical protein
LSFWVATDAAVGRLEAQRLFANDVYDARGVVFYQGGNGSWAFDSLGLACGISVPEPQNYDEFPDDSSVVFPYAMAVDRRTATPDDIDVSNAVVNPLAGIPAVVGYPFLGLLRDDGSVISDTSVYGAVPTVADPLGRAPGLILLSMSKTPPHSMVLAHEMLHLLTGLEHCQGILPVESCNWEQVENIFTGIDERLPVWNGKTGSDARVSTPSQWQEADLSLITVTTSGSTYDQCTPTRGSPWTHF